MFVYNERVVDNVLWRRMKRVKTFGIDRNQIGNVLLLHCLDEEKGITGEA
jgi:hypothetical protein